MYMIEQLAAPVNDLRESQEAEPEETEEDVMRHYRVKPEPSSRPARPEFLSDGRPILQAREGNTLIEVMQQMIRIFRRDLKGEDLLIASRWVEKVIGKPLRNGAWDSEHEDAFVRAQERFYWEANWPTAESPELATLRASYRKA